MESLQALSLKAIAEPLEEAKKLPRKHPLAHDLYKEEHKRKFRQVMSQLICLYTCACSEWCYLYGQSLVFEDLFASIVAEFWKNDKRSI